MFKFFLASCLCILTLCASVGVGHADMVTRLYDFEPGDVISSQEVDDEFNQLVNLVSGVTVDKFIYCRNNSDTEPAVRFDQAGGAGPIMELRQSNSNRIVFQDDSITMSGTGSQQFIFDVTVGDDWNVENIAGTYQLETGGNVVFSATSDHVTTLMPQVWSTQDYQIDDNGGGTAASATLIPRSSTVNCTCNDTDGCDVTMSETDAAQGQIVMINVASANSCNFADTSGVTELAGAFAGGQWDSITMFYNGTRWVETSRSNN